MSKKRNTSKRANFSRGHQFTIIAKKNYVFIQGDLHIPWLVSPEQPKVYVFWKAESVTWNAVVIRKTFFNLLSGSVFSNRDSLLNTWRLFTTFLFFKAFEGESERRDRVHEAREGCGGRGRGRKREINIGLPFLCQDSRFAPPFSFLAILSNDEIEIRVNRGLITVNSTCSNLPYKQDDMTPSSGYIHYALKFQPRFTICGLQNAFYII